LPRPRRAAPALAGGTRRNGTGPKQTRPRGTSVPRGRGRHLTAPVSGVFLVGYPGGRVRRPQGPRRVAAEHAPCRGFRRPLLLPRHERQQHRLLALGAAVAFPTAGLLTAAQLVELEIVPQFPIPPVARVAEQRRPQDAAGFLGLLRPGQ